MTFALAIKKWSVQPSENRAIKFQAEFIPLPECGPRRLFQ